MVGRPVDGIEISMEVATSKNGYQATVYRKVQNEEDGLIVFRKEPHIGLDRNKKIAMAKALHELAVTLQEEALHERRSR